MTKTAHTARSNADQRAAALRRAAEERLDHTPPEQATSASPADLLHELQVHQIELEMQNEELRRAQLALEESRDRYLDLYEFAPVGYLSLDRAGLIVGGNLTAAALLGVERAKLLQKRFDRFVEEEDRDLWRRHLLALWGGTGHESLTAELRLRRGDGSSSTAQLYSFVPAIAGENASVRIAISDVSRRRQAEDALRESQAFLAAVLDAIGDAVVVVDRQFRILKANREYFRQSGCDEAEIIGRHCYAVSHQVARPCDELGESCAVRQTLADGCNHAVTHQHVRRDGTKMYIESNSYPLRDQQGRISAVVETLADVTELRRLEQEHETLRQQLHQAQKMEAIGLLAGGIAHDFNNMLGVILGRAEMALMQVPPGGERLQHSLAEITRAGQRSAALVAQLLAFARKQTVSPRIVDLNEVVAGMLSMLRRLIGEDIALCWQPGGDLWRVKIDSTQVDQLLANLVVNARDAIAGQGRIDISTANVRLAEQEAAAMEGALAGEYVQLAVIDSGSGMTPEVLAHIFEPFFTTKELGQGTGLGLATVYGAVRQNGGCIRMESMPGQGTSCWILLPRHCGDITVAPLESGPMAKGGGETLLLVEDEPALLAMTRRVLEGLGYTVLAASSPGVALELAGTHGAAVSLLITDVVLPEMNGRALVERLRQHNPSLRCLFMSDYSVDVISERDMLGGEVNFVGKPFAIKELAAQVRQVLDRE
ncbi:MAG: hypothetical protein BWK76_27775 [Desulfobulbaceae bacterium A2]|nr:MAG: hypothetical protein BWK76_27775 [Desulfobulbaceae bacterium A2]